MSFDVYVQRFRRGEKAGIPARTLRAAFPGLVKVIDEDYWKLVFSACESTDVFMQPLGDGDDAFHALSFHRPCADGRLWQGIWDLLGLEGCVFHFPGCQSVLARDFATIEDLPAEMGASLGIALAAGPGDLVRAVAEVE